VCVCAAARARVCVCVCLCVLGSKRAKPFLCVCVFVMRARRGARAVLCARVPTVATSDKQPCARRGFASVQPESRETRKTPGAAHRQRAAARAPCFARACPQLPPPTSSRACARRCLAWRGFASVQPESRAGRKTPGAAHRQRAAPRRGALLRAAPRCAAQQRGGVGQTDVGQSGARKTCRNHAPLCRFSPALRAGARLRRALHLRAAPA
jgi:predicted membrane metal-binding protein